MVATRPGLRIDVVDCAGVNAYVVGDSRECTMVDAPDDADALLAAVGRRRLTRILLTHGHRDHVAAAMTVADATRSPVLLHADDYDLWRDAFPWVWPAHVLVDAMTFDVAGAALEAIQLPGHTAGGMCFYLPSSAALFAGDCLDARGAGRGYNVAADPDGLVSGIRARLFTLPPETVVYPGHGGAGRIGALRWEMEFWG